MVSAAKTISTDKEIVIATPKSPSIVSAGCSEVDGNILSGKSKALKGTTKKESMDQKTKTLDNAEIVEVHQSPARSAGGSSSTGSSTWSVKMSPIKKRFSFKRSTSVVTAPNPPTTEEKIDNDHDKKENEIKDEVHFSMTRVYLVTCNSRRGVHFLKHTIRTVLFQFVIMFMGSKATPNLRVLSLVVQNVSVSLICYALIFILFIHYMLCLIDIHLFVLKL